MSSVRAQVIDRVQAKVFPMESKLFARCYKPERMEHVGLTLMLWMPRSQGLMARLYPLMQRAFYEA